MLKATVRIKSLLELTVAEGRIHDHQAGSVAADRQAWLWSRS